MCPHDSPEGGRNLEDRLGDWCGETSPLPSPFRSGGELEDQLGDRLED
jgi:hypothetical protein